MSARREFTKAIRVEIIKRASTGNMGATICEQCGATARGAWEIDHRDPDAMQIDKRRPLTASDGWLLCLPCHKEKSASDAGKLAKAKRIEAAHLGAKPAPTRGFAKAAKPDKPPLRVAEGEPEIMRRFK